MKHFLSSVLIVIFVLVAYTANSQNQETNTKPEKARPSQLSDEQFEAEAIALAYIHCKTDMAEYNYNLEKDNHMLKVAFQNMVILRGQFDIKAFQRFSSDTVYYEKFIKEVQKVKKDLEICVEYQSILDSIANQQKQTKNKSE